MKSIAIALGLSVSISGLAHAQSESSFCHHAGLTYSPGSMVTMGKSLQKCAVTDAGLSVWSPVTSDDESVESANCVSGGREFGHGSLLNAGSVDLKCSNGIWYTLEPQ